MCLANATQQVHLSLIRLTVMNWMSVMGCENFCSILKYCMSLETGEGRSRWQMLGLVHLVNGDYDVVFPSA